jgi:Cu2+-exporting ATPase
MGTATEVRQLKGSDKGSACAHCGLPVPAALREPEASRQYCCAGCRTAAAILREHGLERYYSLPQRRSQPALGTGAAYAHFDHPSFHDLYVARHSDGSCSVELLLEGVHCASCVWLVERVPLILSGVRRAELEVRRAVVFIEWDPQVIQLSAIARCLDSLGYPPRPLRGSSREAVQRREDRAALARLGVAGALAANTMLLALALYSGAWSGMEEQYTRFFRWASLALTVPAVLGPGRIFFTSAFAALRTRTLHMDVPIALGLAAGLVRGAVNTISDSGPIYLDGVAMLVFLLLAGRYVQQRGQRAAANATELFSSLTPSAAHLVEAGGTRRDVPVEALLPEQQVLVGPGETVPADGEVVEGRSWLDQSLLSGEATPRQVSTGEIVYAGTVNLASPLVIRVTRAGEESRIGQLVRQMEASLRERPPVVAMADRLAGWFTAAVLALALAAFALWYPVDRSLAVDHAVALLVISCPCALALATPLAVAAAIGKAARRGILIRSGAALEHLARPARFFLDKTGTVTERGLRLLAWEGPEWAKPLVLALERNVQHPIADALRAAWSELNVPDCEPGTLTYTHGRGISGRVLGHQVRVGSPAFFAAPKSPSPFPGATPLLVAVDGELVGRAWLGSQLRVGARQVVATLQARGWRVELLSGDDPEVVQTVGVSLGIDPAACRGAVLPEDKLAAVQSARREGAVIMVGDGVNDAAALAAATVGVAVHGGAEAALSVADVYLAGPGLDQLLALVEGARRTMRTIERGIIFSLGYNVVGIALAFAGLVAPWLAALLMPTSSLTVLIAAWRSRTFD